jgi:hypothetical protein
VRPQQILVDAPVNEEQLAPVLVHHRLSRRAVTHVKTINVSGMSHIFHPSQVVGHNRSFDAKAQRRKEKMTISASLRVWVQKYSVFPEVLLVYSAIASGWTFGLRS